MKETIGKINKFRDERNWRQFHNEKDLAISISLEASELLELFQWKTSEVTVSEKLPQIKEELADVFIYAFMLADNLNLDVEKIITDIERSLQNSLVSEISSKELGEKVLEKLRELDQVAYVRFASVYKEFNDIKSFIEIVEEIKKD